MIIEQYRLILQHRIIDTDDSESKPSKLEPDMVVESNNQFGATVPKSAQLQYLLHNMANLLNKDEVEDS